MGRCSVLGCRMKKYKKHPNITLHRLPTCKERKEQWLDIVGIENLNTTTKHIFICSLHFEEKYFNRTLNVTRLCDDALPSRESLLPVQFNECEEQQCVSHIALEEEPVCSTPSYANLPEQINKYEEQQFVSCKLFEEKPVCSTSNYTHVKALEIIQKFKSKCELQKKKIKRLSEQVRRQSKKIADFKILMKYLKDKNYLIYDHAVLEKCVGPNIFLKDKLKNR